ncbi:MAG: hypothetical protein A2Y17_00365 [Clostridiales bacterium GWF2_38_85]|nr:MAG: hypothetical protein A2Y17_00365 [Clostridiales bacterium GWF2_38_85]HBL83553.1 hypothetical protein [Clostridiales bacterium]
MEKKTEFTIEEFKLEQPIYVVGRTVRVTHGTPECFPAISALKANFLANDVPSIITNIQKPVIRFGICKDHHVPSEGLIEFTYMIGVQTTGQTFENLIDDMELHIIPEGDYVRIKVSAPDADTAIGTAYVNLSNWFNESTEWAGAGEFEVYPNESTDAEMEFWNGLKRKNF